MTSVSNKGARGPRQVPPTTENSSSRSGSYADKSTSAIPNGAFGSVHGRNIVDLDQIERRDRMHTGRDVSIDHDDEEAAEPPLRRRQPSSSGNLNNKSNGIRQSVNNGARSPVLDDEDRMDVDHGGDEEEYDAEADMVSESDAAEASETATQLLLKVCAEFLEGDKAKQTRGIHSSIIHDKATLDDIVADIYQQPLPRLGNGNIDFAQLSTISLGLDQVTGGNGPRSVTGADNGAIVQDAVYVLATKWAMVVRHFNEFRKHIMVLNKRKDTLSDQERTAVKRYEAKLNVCFYIMHLGYDNAINNLKFQMLRQNVGIDDRQTPGVPHSWVNGLLATQKRLSFWVGEPDPVIKEEKNKNSDISAEFKRYIAGRLMELDLRRDAGGQYLFSQRTEFAINSSTGERYPKQTGEWQNYKAIYDFIQEECQNNQQFRDARASVPRLCENALEYVAPLDPRGSDRSEVDCLPIVHINRFSFGFNNGVFDIHAKKFYVNERDEFGRDIPIDKKYVCKFFPVDFELKWLDPEFDWRTIPTPKFDSIFKNQKFEQQGIDAEKMLLRVAETEHLDELRRVAKQQAQKLGKNSAASSAKTTPAHSAKTTPSHTPVASPMVPTPSKKRKLATQKNTIPDIGLNPLIDSLDAMDVSSSEEGRDDDNPLPIPLTDTQKFLGDKQWKNLRSKYGKSSDDTRKSFTPSQKEVYDRLEKRGQDPHACIDWIYAFSGRMLFPIPTKCGGLDHWERMLVLLGWAGTGKSTFGQIISAFYPPDKVNVIGNRTEEIFGLEATLTSFINAAYDINHNFQLDLCDWKSIVSGEALQIRRKNKLAITSEIPGSWIIICNALPTWADEQGSLSRRLVLMRFLHAIDETKMDANLLRDIITQELSFLCVKLTLAYHEKIKQVGSNPVKLHWSYYFDKSVADIEALNNAIEGFLNRTDIIYVAPYNENEDNSNWEMVYIPDHILGSVFRDYCASEKIGHLSWSVDEIAPRLKNGMHNRYIIPFEGALVYPRPSNWTVSPAAPGQRPEWYWRGIDLKQNMPMNTGNASGGGGDGGNNGGTTAGAHLFGNTSIHT